MKRSFICSMAPALAGAVLLGIAALAEAQVVTTGIVIGASPDKGLVTVRSDQSNRAMNFVNMDKAPISRASGKPATFEDIWSGMRVTISYAQRGNRWFVTGMSIPDPPPPPPSQDWIWKLTPGERHALFTPRSNDITKRSGNRAFTDNDITIKPPRRALFDNDITIRNDNR